MTRTVSQSSVSSYYGMAIEDSIVMKQEDATLSFLNEKGICEGFVFALCVGGTAKVLVREREMEVMHRNMLCLAPGESVVLFDESCDFRVSWMLLSEIFMSEILYRFPNVLFDYLGKFIVVELSEAYVRGLCSYIELLMVKLQDNDNVFQKDIVYNILYAYLLDMYYHIGNTFDEMPIGKTASERMYDSFHMLVMAHIRENKSISFYAESLNITPKHLSKIVKDVTGLSVKKWLDEKMVAELKDVLVSTSSSLKEVSLEFDFTSCDSMYHFFKKHTGVSPSTYRSSGGGCLSTIDNKYR